MLVYRITTKELSASLNASGNPARWNSKDNYVIYTSSSRALACLENIVHRSGEGLNKIFKVVIIEIPGAVKIKKLQINKLKPLWFEFKNYRISQAIGDLWLTKLQSCVLQVPSAIIREESNYLINPAHPEFSSIKILKVEDFEIDVRLKK
jgi:RES domain-containing protein